MLRSHWTKLFILLVLLLTPSLFVSNMKVGVIKPVDTSSPSQSAGWLTGWQYRKSHTIQGAVGAGTNYQVRIIVHRLTGTDSGENVYVGTKCKSDFGDIRFTDADGVTVLNSWLQEYDSTQAVFWVRIADNLDDWVHIYIYFGNGTVTSNSDGSVTFIAFDDFDFGYSSGDAPDPEKGWVVYNQEGGDLLEVAPNPSGRQGNGLRYYSAEGIAPVQWLGMNWTKTFGVAVHFDFYWENRDEQFRIDIYDYEDTSPWAGTWANPQHAWHLKYYPPDWPPPLDYSPEIIIAEDSWYDFEFQCTNTTYTLVVDETSHLGGLRATGDGYNSLLIYGYWNFYDEFYLDDFYVRKYVEIEPAHSTWGTVEEFSTTPTGPGEIDPWTILIIVGGGGAVIAIALVLVIVIRKSESGGSSQIPYNW